MAQLSPWHIPMALPPDPATLARLGSQLTPEQAQANALSMRSPPQSQGVMDMYGGDPQDASDLMPGAPGTGDKLRASLGATNGPRQYAKASISNQDTSNFKRMNTAFNSMNENQYRANAMHAQGLYPERTGYEQAVDSQGNPLVRQDQNGNPISDESGKAIPIYDQNRPIYNFDKVTADESDPVRQQIKGTDRLQELLGMEANANLKRNTMDFTPLGALADSLKAERGIKSNISAGMSAPQDRTEAFNKFADEIQKRRADIQKSIYENMRNQKGGTSLDLWMASQMGKQNQDVGEGNPSGRMYIDPQRRLDNPRFMAAQKYVNDNPQLQKSIAASFAAQNELDLTNQKISGTVTPEQFHALQQQVRRLPGVLLSANGGNSGEAERDATYMNSIVKQLGQVLDEKLANGLSGIDANDPQLQHFRALSAQIRDKYKGLASGKLDTVSAGLGDVLDRNPDFKQSWNTMLTKAGGLISNGRTDGSALPSAISAPPLGGAAPKRRAAPAASAPQPGPAPQAGKLMSPDEFFASLKKGK